MRVCLVILALLCLVVLGTADTSRDIIHEVAHSFAEKGYVRQDPFELSPQEQQHTEVLESKHLLAKNAPVESATRFKESAPEEIVPQASDKQAMTLPTLMETHSSVGISRAHSKRRTGFLLASIYQAGQKLANKLSGKFQPSNSQIFEDCMACRMVWRQVEMDISNARYVEDIQASFEHNCMDAQKSTLFYKACEDMYDDIYAMTDDYMSGQYTVDQMCQRAKLCISPVY